MVVEFIEFPEWTVTGIGVTETGQVVVYLAPAQD